MKKRFPLFAFLLFFTMVSVGQNQFSFKRDSTLQGKLGLSFKKKWQLPILKDSLVIRDRNFQNLDNLGSKAWVDRTNMPIFEPKGNHRMPIYEPDSKIKYKMRIFNIDE